MQQNKYLQPVSSQPNQKGNNVSWDEENISFEIQEQEPPMRSDVEVNIFSKLKKLSLQDLNLNSSESKSDVLPITPKDRNAYLVMHLPKLSTLVESI